MFNVEESEAQAHRPMHISSLAFEKDGWMLDEEGREIQQPEDSFYRRVDKTLLTCSLSLRFSYPHTVFPSRDRAFML